MSILNASLPNPCLSSSFQPPIYEFSNFNISKHFRTEYPADWGYINGTVDFTIRDVANNYSLTCNWGPSLRVWSDEKEWSTWDCANSLTGKRIEPDSRTPTNLNINGSDFLKGQPLGSPIRIAQYWYCDPKNGSYPEVYQSRAEFKLNVTCPAEVQQDGLDTVPCNVTTELPVRATAQWTPRGTPYPGTSQIELKPISGDARRGLNPTPSRDCTDLSLTYPDWTLHDFTYTKFVSNDPRTAKVDLNLTSRATGIRVRCRWGSDVGVYDTWVIGDYMLEPACVQDEADTLRSNSTFLIRFNRATRAFTIRQSWVCGDVSGAASTEFTAESGANMALVCVDNLCRAEPPNMKLEGHLTKPFELTPAALRGPEGASNPNCLFNSDPENGSVWQVNRFLWQATTVDAQRRPFFPSEPVPYSRMLHFEMKNNANGVVTSCSFDDYELDNPSDDRWWPCFPSADLDPHAPPLRHFVETYIQFRRSTSQVFINQTWYCADTQAATPYMITATGSTPMPRWGLACGTSTSTWVNATCPLVWFVPDSDNCTVTYAARWCTLGNKDGYAIGPGLSLSPQINITRLPAGELTEPAPSSGKWSCTAASLGDVVWRFQPTSFRYIAETEWPGASREDRLETVFLINLNSSVFDGHPSSGAGVVVVRDIGMHHLADTFELTPWLRGSDPAKWYDDRSEYPYLQRNPGITGVYNLLRWELRTDLAKGWVEVRHSWYCDDKNAETPIIFNGSWSGYLPLRCSYHYEGPYDLYNSGVHCLLVGNEFVVRPSITHTLVRGRLPKDAR